MQSFILWYLLVTLIGLIGFPIVFKCLPALPDKGYAAARAAGLLVWGFLFWLLGSFGLLANSLGGQLVALTIVLLVSGWLLVKQWDEISAWFKNQAQYILWVEVVFLLAFTLWAIVRAANPDISGTEKPMEMAFINATLRSPGFPPNDPWLAGYGISYYYFGYVLVSMLIRITGVASGVGFNLAVALWFSLTAVSAFGVVYNLLVKRWGDGQNLAARLGALLGPFFILISSNLEGIFEFFHARGIGWTMNPDGVFTSRFWTWLDIKELSTQPIQPFSWTPNRAGGVLWWRASRVLSDYDLNGGWREVIDEFPFFSYLLADLHPHVLGMPFVLLCILLALNFYIQGKESPLFSGRWQDWLTAPGFWVSAICIGSLGFFNTWDMPIYAGLLAAVQFMARYHQLGWHWKRLVESLTFLVIMILAGVILYLPFYLGFSSQAGGIAPSLAFFTRGVHFWIMFGGLLLPIIGWLIFEIAGRKKPIAVKPGIGIGLLIVAGLAIASFGSAALILTVLQNPAYLASQNPIMMKLVESASGLVGLQGNADAQTLVSLSLARRLAQPGTWVTLLGLLIMVIGLLAYRQRFQSSEDTTPVESPHPNGFVLLLVLLGIGLTVFPEFFYLRDQFGWRMNTIFKFYFQAWMVWGLAAAVASAVLLREVKRYRWLMTTFVTIILLSTLAYPVFALREKTANFRPLRFTLDGAAFVSEYFPADADAIDWLKKAPLGVVAEAVSRDGGSYSFYGRVATFSGHPNVLGWIWHESQWRGGLTEVGTRKQDMELLYQTDDWWQALAIIQRYKIRYIYIGGMELNEYVVNQDKFRANLAPVYQNDGVVIYYVNDAFLAQVKGLTQSP